jgi:uncharacterized protein YfaS (alpha-2-macroglobulin family)
MKTLKLICAQVVISFFSLQLSAANPIIDIKADPLWKKSVDLANKQQFQSALAPLEELKSQLLKQNNESFDLTKVMLQIARYKIALHGVETAVKDLKSEVWPKTFKPLSLMRLLYGQMLVQYVNYYDYEINSRTRMAQATDLKDLTMDQIYGLALNEYTDLWVQRRQLQSLNKDTFGEFINPNSYPNEVRGSLYDSYIALFRSLLTDTRSWTPEQLNEVFTLNFEDLIRGKTVDFKNPKTHPLSKIAFMLNDQYLENKRLGKKSGALQAKLDLYTLLYGKFESEKAQSRILTELDIVNNEFKDDPWYSMGLAVKAELIRNQNSPTNLVEAHKWAELGNKAFPNSHGAKRCRDILKQIERPQFQLDGMAVDGPQMKKTLNLLYANTNKIYFRSIPFDIATFVKTSKDYNLLPSYREFQEILKKKPDYEWSQNLITTNDYKNHRQYVNLPEHKKGFYIIVASLQPDFGNSNNLLTGVMITISDWVLSHRLWDNSGKFNVFLQNGTDGKSIAGTPVQLYRLDYQNTHQLMATKATDAEGMAQFQVPKDQGSSNYVVLVQDKNNLIFTSQGLYLFGGNEHRAPYVQTHNFLYTDRAIYRPGQKILWKILSFQGGKPRGIYKSAGNKNLQVQLRDANQEILLKKDVNTDQFGSAFGEFVIPSGKLLGQWQLVLADYSASSFVKVEEYKRPTFEVQMEDSKKPLRLNDKAQVSGLAKYFFGMPVTAGKANFRIYRNGILPWWSSWCFWDWSFFLREQLVEFGKTELDKDGRFLISFAPKADNDLSKNADGKVNQDLRYNYRVEVDVTDEGGETRTAQRDYYIGFVNVMASLSGEQGFYLENQGVKINLNRSDLSGSPKKAKGTFTLYLLQEPKEVLLPSQVKTPSQFSQFFQGLRTEGDDESPRYHSNYNWQMHVHSWALGSKINEVQHDHTEFKIDSLKGGIYRLLYKTQDDFGNEIATSQHLVVAHKNSQFKLPIFAAFEKSSVPVGQQARLFLMDGSSKHDFVMERFQDQKMQERKILNGGQILEWTAKDSDRGGFSVSVSWLKNFEDIALHNHLYVPWDDRQLTLAWSSFRDKLKPGDKETWELTIKGHDQKDLKSRAAQVLAFMYDKSLDLFASHAISNPTSIYPYGTGVQSWTSILSNAPRAYFESHIPYHDEFYPFHDDSMILEFNYGIGGPGRRGGFGISEIGAGYPSEKTGMVLADSALSAAPSVAKLARTSKQGEELSKESKRKVGDVKDSKNEIASSVSPEARPDDGTNTATAAVALRSQFQETAFWLPQLINEQNGGIKVQFTVPDSLTEWNIWALAVTQDLRAGTLLAKAQTIKEVMVRPYLPRFFREGDRVALKLVINNSTEQNINGDLELNLKDPLNQKIRNQDFKLELSTKKWNLKPKASDNITAWVTVPNTVGSILVEVRVRSQNGFSDGEQRELPIIPGRMHLDQSRFKVIKDKTSKELQFADLKNNTDTSLINEKMIVTLDSQLFYSVLSALPYLVNYPYECVEQTLNRFVSTGILTSIFKQFPSVAKMAKTFSERKTSLETWTADDPNRKIALEETPWLQESRGHIAADGVDPQLIKVLDPRAATKTKEGALKDLTKVQTSLGAFPWFPGGPPSPYITIYVLYGLSKAIEFGVDVPRPMVEKAWSYLKLHYLDSEVKTAIAQNCCWEEITFLNYVLSNYKDKSWGTQIFTENDRNEMLNFSFRHWKAHSPYLKGYLALTLLRSQRASDAKLVWDSVMDSAKTSEDEGTHWMAEDRSWLWYNDTIETQAFALRTGMELGTKPELLDGMVLWLFLNKKLNHWKSTRATAEVIYSLTHYLKKAGQLGTKENAKVSVGTFAKSFEFFPDQYTGKHNQILIEGANVTKDTATIKIEKTTPGYMFASATWHFSTTKVPTEAKGNFIEIQKSYFKREVKEGVMQLIPLATLKKALVLGDEVEVQISIKSKHTVGFVHLRDPRPAGFEPVRFNSMHQWDLGLYWYEEVRDTGTNFFFERLPHGQYTFKYRLRASSAGLFTAAPATIQPMYAPEFTAYSAGQKIEIGI